jgi:phage shock protein PspC (stress-responsive transcriptional regulator)
VEPTRLLRDPEAGLLLGVAAGLSRALGPGAWVFRVFFAIFTFLGATGIVIYVLMAVAMPRHDGFGGEVPGTGSPERLIAVVLAAIATVVLVSLFLL